MCFRWIGWGIFNDDSSDGSLFYMCIIIYALLQLVRWSHRAQGLQAQMKVPMMALLTTDWMSPEMTRLDASCVIRLET
jgi:hypothetical protein